MKKKAVWEFILVALSMFLGTTTLMTLTFWLNSSKKLEFIWWILILGWYSLVSIIYAFIHVYILKEQRFNQLLSY